MDNRQLDQLIRSHGQNVEGELGYWQFAAYEVGMICVTDESHNRMRVITPIADAEKLPLEVLEACMIANFDRALDARYCVNQGTIWGAFIHPLRELTDDQFISALQQVAGVATNFGDSYSSGDLVFGGG